MFQSVDDTITKEAKSSPLSVDCASASDRYTIPSSPEQEPASFDKQFRAPKTGSNVPKTTQETPESSAWVISPPVLAYRPKHGPTNNAKANDDAEESSAWPISPPVPAERSKLISSSGTKPKDDAGDSRAWAISPPLTAHRSKHVPSNGTKPIEDAEDSRSWAISPPVPAHRSKHVPSNGTKPNDDAEDSRAWEISPPVPAHQIKHVPSNGTRAVEDAEDSRAWAISPPVPAHRSKHVPSNGTRAVEDAEESRAWAISPPVPAHRSKHVPSNGTKTYDEDDDDGDDEDGDDEDSNGDFRARALSDPVPAIYSKHVLSDKTIPDDDGSNAKVISKPLLRSKHVLADDRKVCNDGDGSRARAISPPVPACKKKIVSNSLEQRHSTDVHEAEIVSPPIPTLQKKMTKAAKTDAIKAEVSATSNQKNAVHTNDSESFVQKAVKHVFCMTESTVSTTSSDQTVRTITKPKQQESIQKKGKANSEMEVLQQELAKARQAIAELQQKKVQCENVVRARNQQRMEKNKSRKEDQQQMVQYNEYEQKGGGSFCNEKEENGEEEHCADTSIEDGDPNTGFHNQVPEHKLMGNLVVDDSRRKMQQQLNRNQVDDDGNDDDGDDDDDCDENDVGYVAEDNLREQRTARPQKVQRNNDVDSLTYACATYGSVNHYKMVKLKRQMERQRLKRIQARSPVLEGFKKTPRQPPTGRMERSVPHNRSESYSYGQRYENDDEGEHMIPQRGGRSNNRVHDSLAYSRHFNTDLPKRRANELTENRELKHRGQERQHFGSARVSSQRHRDRGRSVTPTEPEKSVEYRRNMPTRVNPTRQMQTNCTDQNDIFRQRTGLEIEAARRKQHRAVSGNELYGSDEFKRPSLRDGETSYFPSRSQKNFRKDDDMEDEELQPRANTQEQVYGRRKSNFIEQPYNDEACLDQNRSRPEWLDDGKVDNRDQTRSQRVYEEQEYEDFSSVRYHEDEPQEFRRRTLRPRAAVRPLQAEGPIQGPSAGRRKRPAQGPRRNQQQRAIPQGPFRRPKDQTRQPVKPPDKKRKRMMAMTKNGFLYATYTEI